VESENRMDNPKREAFFAKEIVERYGETLYHYALKLTCHPFDAKDLVQETFLKAWLHYEDLKETNATFSWLKTICFREFLHLAKKKKLPTESAQSMEQLSQETDFELKDMAPDMAEEVIVAEEIKDMQNGCFLAMVRKLTLEQRIAFSLSDMYGLNIDTIAEVLQVNKGAAKALLYRARMNIDAFFSDHCSILSADNPCSCKAWITFSDTRGQLQKNAKEIVTSQVLDYEKKKYVFDENVRKKIYYLYKTMPDKKPEDGWYEQVIQSLFQKSQEL